MGGWDGRWAGGGWRAEGFGQVAGSMPVARGGGGQGGEGSACRTEHSDILSSDY